MNNPSPLRNPCPFPNQTLISRSASPSTVDGQSMQTSDYLDDPPTYTRTTWAGHSAPCIVNHSIQYHATLDGQTPSGEYPPQEILPADLTDLQRVEVVAQRHWSTYSQTGQVRGIPMSISGMGTITGGDSVSSLEYTIPNAVTQMVDPSQGTTFTDIQHVVVKAYPRSQMEQTIDTIALPREAIRGLLERRPPHFELSPIYHQPPPLSFLFPYVANPRHTRLSPPPLCPRTPQYMRGRLENHAYEIFQVGHDLINQFDSRVRPLVSTRIRYHPFMPRRFQDGYIPRALRDGAEDPLEDEEFTEDEDAAVDVRSTAPSPSEHADDYALHEHDFDRQHSGYVPPSDDFEHSDDDDTETGSATQSYHLSIRNDSTTDSNDAVDDEDADHDSIASSRPDPDEDASGSGEELDDHASSHNDESADASEGDGWTAADVLAAQAHSAVIDLTSDDEDHPTHDSEEFSDAERVNWGNTSEDMSVVQRPTEIALELAALYPDASSHESDHVDQLAGYSSDDVEYIDTEPEDEDEEMMREGDEFFAGVASEVAGRVGNSSESVPEFLVEGDDSVHATHDGSPAKTTNLSQQIERDVHAHVDSRERTSAWVGLIRTIPRMEDVRSPPVRSSPTPVPPDEPIIVRGRHDTPHPYVLHGTKREQPMIVRKRPCPDSPPPSEGFWKGVARLSAINSSTLEPRAYSSSDPPSTLSPTSPSEGVVLYNTPLCLRCCKAGHTFKTCSEPPVKLTTRLRPTPSPASDGAARRNSSSGIEGRPPSPVDACTQIALPLSNATTGLSAATSPTLSDLIPDNFQFNDYDITLTPPTPVEGSMPSLEDVSESSSFESPGSESDDDESPKTIRPVLYRAPPFRNASSNVPTLASPPDAAPPAKTAADSSAFMVEWRANAQVIRKARETNTKLGFNLRSLLSCEGPSAHLSPAEKIDGVIHLLDDACSELTALIDDPKPALTCSLTRQAFEIAADIRSRLTHARLHVADQTLYEVLNSDQLSRAVWQLVSLSPASTLNSFHPVCYSADDVQLHRWIDNQFRKSIMNAAGTGSVIRAPTFLHVSSHHPLTTTNSTLSPLPAPLGTAAPNNPAYESRRGAWAGPGAERYTHIYDTRLAHVRVLEVAYEYMITSGLEDEVRLRLGSLEEHTRGNPLFYVEESVFLLAFANVYARQEVVRDTVAGPVSLTLSEDSSDMRGLVLRELPQGGNLVRGWMRSNYLGGPHRAIADLVRDELERRANTARWL
ncbi:hypothetical protein BD626DRAFT_631396 [Schizophyllum amplum]|uniref:Uncharacterized protein n=1 Tax=Schizophyllum amplum TaxID=97359 RepID=A0A550CAC6_9AGAR|nr:hypothetical protein BD626DRAFT_631396 [Auriculariopsis ampla]